jgi:hypothetical protein
MKISADWRVAWIQLIAPFKQVPPERRRKSRSENFPLILVNKLGFSCSSTSCDEFQSVELTDYQRIDPVTKVRHRNVAVMQIYSVFEFSMLSREITMQIPKRTEEYRLDRYLRASRVPLLLKSAWSDQELEKKQCSLRSATWKPSSLLK